MKSNRLALSFLLLLQAFSARPIGFWMIKGSNLPDMDGYRELMDFALQNERSVSAFIPDEYWKAPLSKQEIGGKLAALYSLLAAEADDPPNQDLRLLRGLVCHYLYNLDLREYYQPAIDNWNSIASLPDHDYRFKWMLGMHYATAVKPYEAIEQFAYVAGRLPEEKLHPVFWKDYAYAAALAFMPVRAMKCFELFARYGGASLEGESLYQSLKKNLVIPGRDEDRKSAELYRPFQRQEGLGLLSRPFGLWLPVAESWKLKLGDYANGRSFVAITPEGIKDESGREVTYTIAMICRVVGDGGGEEWLESYRNHRLADGLAVGPRFEVHEYDDPDKYIHLGGLHGFVAYAEAEEPSLPGEKIEAPCRLHPGREPAKEAGLGSGSVKYLALNPELSRFEGRIEYVFLLDTCNAIFEESKQVFERFLQGVVIE